MAALPLGIGGVFYINLDSREDRRQQIEEELTKVELPFERFPALRGDPNIVFSGIKGTAALVGCGLSHLAVIKEARARKYESVLIFEDDFTFAVDKESFWNILGNIEKEVEDDFDVVMLGYNLNESEEHSTHLRRILKAQNACCYIVHSRFYDEIIALYDWAIPKLQETGSHWIYANDQVWKTLQPKSRWYAAVPRLGRQRPSYSDCGESFVSYDD